MFIFAVILALISLLAIVGMLIVEENPIIPFAMLVFFTLYLMGIGN